MWSEAVVSLKLQEKTVMYGVLHRYHQLLDDIHQCYLDQREALLSPSLTSTISDLTGQNNKDHCALVQAFRVQPFTRFHLSC